MGQAVRSNSGYRGRETQYPGETLNLTGPRGARILWKSGIVELALALLTATPVLAQMGQQPARARNTGGTRGPANGEPSNAPGSGPTRLPLLP